MFFLLVVFNTLKQNFSLYLKTIFLTQILYLSTDAGLTEEMMLTLITPLHEGRLNLLFALRM